jgi:hypothetical protein
MEIAILRQDYGVGMNDALKEWFRVGRERFWVQPALNDVGENLSLSHRAAVR